MEKSKNLIILFIGLIFSLPAYSQKVIEDSEGVSYLSISSRDNILLPKGKWEIKWVGNIDFCRPENRAQCRGTQGKAVALQNNEKNNPVYSLLVRYTSSVISNWPGGICYTRSTLFTDFHETRANDLRNKCSSGWYITDPNQIHRGWWWDMVKDGYSSLELKKQKQVMLEVMVQQNNKRRVHMDILSLDGLAVKYDNGSGEETLEIDRQVIMDWKNKYVEIMGKKIFHNKIDFSVKDTDLTYFFYMSEANNSDRSFIYSDSGKLTLAKKDSWVPKDASSHKDNEERAEGEGGNNELLNSLRDDSEREARERAEAQRLAAEREKAQREARERAEAQRLAAEREKAQREARERAEVQRLAAEREALLTRLKQLDRTHEENSSSETTDTRDFGDWLKEKTQN